MIYLIKRTASRLGDAIMLEPLISTVREHHPDDEIWVQVQDWIVPIFQSHPDVSRILPESSAVPQEAIRVLDIATDADCPWAKYAERFNPSITKSKQTIYAKVAGQNIEKFMEKASGRRATRKVSPCVAGDNTATEAVASHREGARQCRRQAPPPPRTRTFY